MNLFIQFKENLINLDNFKAIFNRVKKFDYFFQVVH